MSALWALIQEYFFKRVTFEPLSNFSPTTRVVPTIRFFTAIGVQDTPKSCTITLILRNLLPSSTEPITEYGKSKLQNSVVQHYIIFVHLHASGAYEKFPLHFDRENEEWSENLFSFTPWLKEYGSFPCCIDA